MLLRSGVARLRLVDFDQVTLSSLNRHAVATRADVGTPKALALARHFREISPETLVDARVAMYDEVRLTEGHRALVPHAHTASCSPPRRSCWAASPPACLTA
jgi:tRNA A37 threonylcarbamoyladenosine dehydratase